MLSEFTVSEVLAQHCRSTAPGANRGEAPLLRYAFFAMIGFKNSFPYRLRTRRGRKQYPG